MTTQNKTRLEFLTGLLVLIVIPAVAWLVVILAILSATPSRP